ncbi:leucine-rich repeat domain-containing protein [Halioxenophilus sp. WMMB6]|uniref:leucine-rich repeat domain-containing protein n=1 Tax=Halioxenophilus sp. WMMB6 TaxID=3073815 RepID=UPI00295E6A04|nr:leucine-rich repeat domain-containing protein [Halioxenophilus sp. WMMB6]
MLTKKIFPSLVAAVGLLISACSNYQVSLNEMSVYQPPSLLTDVRANDTALADCINQHIKDQQVTEASTLERLLCSSAGISTLAGLSQFRGVQLLNLSDNSITSLTGMQGMAELRELNLANNELTDVQELFNLPKLEWVDLTGNQAVSCTDLQQLSKLPGLTVVAPATCR